MRITTLVSARPSVLLSALFACACSDADNGKRVIASGPIGAEGGTLEAEGIALAIPAGALTTTEQISISVSTAPLDDDGREPLSPRITLEPSGLELAAPVRLSIRTTSDAGGVVWWSSPDGGRELAGFASGGLATATNTHFSDIDTEAPKCPDDPSEQRCAGCDAEPTGEPTCDACDGPDCEANRHEPCRRLCMCDSLAVGLSNSRLCQTREPGDRTLGVCPPDPALPTANGAVFLGISNGNHCAGTSYEPRRETLCECVADTANGPDDTLCPIPWENFAPPDSNNWQCHSTLAWGKLTGEGGLPAPQAPVTGDSDLYLDRTAQAYVESGAPGDVCGGYWLDRTKDLHANGDKIPGHLAGCGDPVPVDYQWREYQGNAVECRQFDWPEGPIVPMTDAQASICRMKQTDQVRLEQMRIACGIPARQTDAQEQAVRRQEDKDGIPQEQRQAFHTLAILDVKTASGSATYVGLNSRARALRPANDNACPGRTVEKPWTWIGYTTVNRRGEIENSNATLTHAEGNALMMVAEERGRSEAADRSLVIPEGGADGGCGVLIVDRTPCAHSCAREGIHTAMFAAGLDKLIVRSPAGCRRFERADYHFRSGQPCGSDDEGCP